MLVKGIMTQISGSVGGITGSHNRGGMYLRGRSIPTDPATVRQQLLRSAAATLTARWRDVLTQAQRDSWAVYAANTPLLSPLGDARDVGALPMYLRGNTVRLQIGEDPVDDPATSGMPTLTQPTAVTITDSGGLLGGTLIADPWVDLADTFLCVYASRPVSESINFWKGPYRLLGSVEGSVTVPPTTFSEDYAAVWGDPVVGQKIFYQLRVVDAFGALSAKIRNSVIVTAGG
jgi:hypothetical protein